MPRAALLAALAILLLLPETGAAEAERGAPSGAEERGAVGYIYVEPNEGGSSGGHAALRFGDEVFHFQHEAPGLLRLHLEEWQDFLFRYSMLENRALHESEIEVSGDTERLLRGAFRRHQMAQDAQLAGLEDLRRDIELLESMVELARGDEPPAGVLGGLGYLTAASAERSAAIDEVARCVARRHGAGYVRAERARLATALRRARPAAEAYEPIPLAAGVYPHLAPSFSSAVADMATTREVLGLLDGGARLDPGVVRRLGGPEGVLGPAEEAFVRRYRDRLADDVCLAVADWTQDRGRALAVGVARLASLEASLAQGRWIVLDLLPLEARRAALPDGDLRAAYLAAAGAAAEEDLALARGELGSAAVAPEAAFVGIEGAVNRLEEARAARGGAPLRLLRGSPLPSRGAVWREPVWPQLEAAEAGRLLASARMAERRLAEAIGALYGYALLERNCVTEIFALANEAISVAAAGSGRGLREESEARLGGYVDASRNYIPKAAAGAVASAYRLAAQRRYPSYRQRRLAEMRRCDPEWQVWLQESNTITSEIYRPGADDSTFVFFTDDAGPMRPLFGAVNLGVALGDSVAGLVLLPAAGSGRLERGLRGTLFSLPELVFVSLRNGTTAWVEPTESRRWLSAASGSGTTPVCPEPLAESRPG